MGVFIQFASTACAVNQVCKLYLYSLPPLRAQSIKYASCIYTVCLHCVQSHSSMQAELIQFAPTACAVNPVCKQYFYNLHTLRTQSIHHVNCIYTVCAHCVRSQSSMQAVFIQFVHTACAVNPVCKPYLYSLRTLRAQSIPYASRIYTVCAHCVRSQSRMQAVFIQFAHTSCAVNIVCKLYLYSLRTLRAQ